MKKFISSVLLFGALAVSFGCATTQSEKTLYSDIGGKETLIKIYITAVKRIYADPQIGHFFKGFPKKELVTHLTNQTCELIGGPCQYTGRSMLESHEGLGITDADMFVLVEHVQQAMREVGISYQQENLILKKLAPMKREIVYQ